MSRSRAGYVAPSKRGTCATCGGFVWLGHESRPNGLARCQNCKRRPRVRIRIYIKTCRCGDVFSTRRSNQRFCCVACHNEHRRKRGFGPRRGTTHERGYGKPHIKVRAMYAASHRDNYPCVRCGQPLGPWGPHLHLDHNEDRTGYLGMAHARCNSIEGARRASGSTPRDRLVTQRCQRGCCEIHIPLMLVREPRPPRQKRTKQKPQPVSHACEVCATDTTRPRYCSSECQVEGNRRRNRDRHRAKVGLAVDWHTPTSLWRQAS